MTLKLFKEPLIGKYDGVSPPTSLELGSVTGGQNMRKVSERGGWKARKGCTFHNTTAIGGESPVAIRSLHQYTHPRLGSGSTDYHFFAQTGGKLYDASNKPPAAGTTFAASEISSLVSSTQPGFSDVIDETWFYADGSGAPLMWGGDGPFCRAFFSYDATAASYVDQTRKVRDDISTTYALVSTGATDKLFICSPLPAKAIILDLGTAVNEDAATLTVKDFNGSWNAVASMSDGTVTGSATLTKDGTISWTPGGDEKKVVVSGVMGYWYELSWSASLSSVIHVISCKIQFDPARLVNMWDGVYELPIAVRRSSAANTIFEDMTGSVTNQSTSQYMTGDITTSDYIYIKTVEPIFAIALGIVEDTGNNEDAQIDLIEYWDGDSWASISTIVDGTLDGGADSSFAQSGIVQWDASSSAPVKRSFTWDNLPGYWYRLSLDAVADAAQIFFVAVGSFPDELSSYDGVIEFKGRALYWGDEEFPNRLRYSAYLKGNAVSGSDSGWTMPFGKASPIVCCRRFYNELMVWKADSIWLLEGYDPRSFGILRITDTVGTCAPATCFVIEAGYPSMHKDESLTIAIWLDTDGVYIIDGRKPKKVSLPVDQFFNPEYSTCISAANLSLCQAFIDRNNNEYHLLIPDGRELVYNYVTDEWYPPWDRQVGTTSEYLVCGLSLRGTDGRFYTYAGNNGGEVFRLENDTTDKSDANADVAITHSIKTRAICAEPKLSTVFEFMFRKVQIEAKARTAGSVTVKFYKDLTTSAETLSTPAGPTLVNTGYGLSVDGVYTSKVGCVAFQLEFESSVADVELELWSFLYQIEAAAEIVLG